MVKKKIIFLIPTLSQGGGERVVSELSLNLPDSIERIIVLFDKQISYPYKGKLICLNIPISNILPIRILYFFIALFRFKKIIKRERPDYTISFIRPANIINILSSRKAVIRVDSFLSSTSGLIYKIFAKLFYNKASKIVCISKASAKDLVDNFRVEKKKIKTIYNPLNIKMVQNLALEPLESEYKKIFTKPVIISIGRLTKEKNHLCLIKIFARVREVVNEAQLVILGTGELESKLKGVIEDLGLENNAHLLGWQNNPFKFLAKSRVFVLASLREGLPYGILEAMACGLPIISTDCKSGPREILAPDTDVTKEAKDIEYAAYGILTPPFNGRKYKENGFLEGTGEILKKAMVKVLVDKELANNLAKKSRQRIEDFDIKNIIKEWEFLNHENNTAD